MLAPQALTHGQRLWWLPANASMHGASLDTHLLLNLWIAFALLGMAHVLLLAGVVWRRTHTPPRTQAWIEFVPVTLLGLLFGSLAVRAETLWRDARYTGANPAAMQVEVTGMQFAWYFRYPGKDAVFGATRPEMVAPGEGNPLGIDSVDSHSADDFVASQLVLPAGREVDLRLRAQDVIHGFSVPEMRLKQNAVPGQTIHLHFTPAVPGDYAILCAQLCGTGHYRMAATLRVLPAAAFDAWLAAHEAPAGLRTGAPQ